MAFQKFELTNDGINLLAQVQAELGSLNFTKIKIGSGVYAGDIKLLTDVITEFHNFPVTSTQVQPDKSVKIQAPFDNSTFTQAHSWREIGIYAKLGETGQEVLYSYSSDPTPDTIPDYDGGLNKYRRTLDIRNYISDVASVTLTVVNLTNKYDFNTVAEMVAASYLVDGDRIKLWGYHNLNDGASHFRVKSVTNDGTGIALDSGGFANLEKSDTVNIKWFGAKGDARLSDGTLNPSPTDDTHAIQEAFKYGVINNRTKVVATSGDSFYIAGTVFIPTTHRAPDFITKQPREGQMIFDFQGAEFVGVDTTSQIMFDSGYFDPSGDLQTIWGTSDEYYLTSGTIFQNYTMTNTYIGVRIKGWVYGCGVKNSIGIDVQQIVKTDRCFYTNFEQLVHRGTYTVGVPIFHFLDNNNIMPLKGLVTGQCDIGYQFDGAIEALRMVDCGIEGFQTYGVLTTGDFNIKFDSCYFESGQGIGYSGRGTNHVTFDNCWGYGDIQMLGDFTDATNIRIRDNNNVSGLARWFDSLPDYCISDFDLPNKINPSGEKIDVYVSPDAINVNRDITIYDPNIGLSKVIGRVEQTNKFHTQRVNGATSGGFGSAGNSLGYIITQEPESGGTQRAIFETGIEYSDTQLVYACFKITHSTGTWFWYGFIVGDGNVSTIYSNTALEPTAINDGGKLKVFSPQLPSSGNLGVSSGEIRII